jgi:hypothetical protein
MIFEKMIDSDWFKCHWEESYCFKPSKEELEDVVYATMTFKYNCPQVMFVFKEGTRIFIPLANNEEYVENSIVPIDKLFITVLIRGNEKIQRVNIIK